MKTTTGIYETHAQADAAIMELKSFGVDITDISYIIDEYTQPNNKVYAYPLGDFHT